MKKKLQKLNYAELYTWHRKVYFSEIFTYVVLAVLSFFVFPGNSTSAILLLGLVMMLVIFYTRRQVNQVIHGWLQDEIDLDSYCSYFDNIVQQKPKLYRHSYFQQSLIAFSQYHYFRGEFEEALELLNLVDLSKVAWVIRKRYEVILKTYQLLSRLNQKDFETIEEELASYSRLKGKIVTKNVAVMQAMYLVLSGETTDHFSQTKPEHKLHEIRAAYYQGLNLLNQDKTDQAKVSFESIIHENPDLFYVKEARNHLKEFTG